MARYQMSDEDKDKLRRNRIYLIQNIVPTETLLSYLRQEDVLSEDMYEEITVEKLKKQKVGKLLDLLPRRGPEAFKVFVKALLSDKQEHVAKFLDESEVKQWKAKQSERTPSHQYPAPPPAPVQQHQKYKPTSFPENEESALFNPEVKPVNLSDEHVTKLIRDTKNNYKMSSNPRGVAVIINNSYFINHRPREGTAFDSQNICTHLEQLYFTTVLYDDLTAEEMKRVFTEQGTKHDHRDEDCFCAVILTHGSRGYVYGIDGKRISIEDDIVAPLCGDRCPSLLNKPKIFFIQACQGDKATEGVDVSEVDAIPIEEVGQAIRDLHINDTEETVPRLSRTHEKSDVVLAYSTVPGYRSWRRTDLGSWFIRAIIKVFAAEAYKEDLLSLLVKVREAVAEYCTKHEDHSFVQLTRTDETTRKKLYLFPGYEESNKASYV